MWSQSDHHISHHSSNVHRPHSHAKGKKPAQTQELMYKLKENQALVQIEESRLLDTHEKVVEALELYEKTVDPHPHTKPTKCLEDVENYVSFQLNNMNGVSGCLKTEGAKETLQRELLPLVEKKARYNKNYEGYYNILKATSRKGRVAKEYWYKMEYGKDIEIDSQSASMAIFELQKGHDKDERRMEHFHNGGDMDKWNQIKHGVKAKHIFPLEDLSQKTKHKELPMTAGFTLEDYKAREKQRQKQAIGILDTITSPSRYSQAKCQEETRQELFISYFKLMEEYNIVMDNKRDSLSDHEWMQEWSLINHKREKFDEEMEEKVNGLMKYKF